MAKERFCDDCGDEMPAGARRFRCPNCNQMVCGWCMHHVHRLSALIQERRVGGAQEGGVVARLRARAEAAERERDALINLVPLRAERVSRWKRAHLLVGPNPRASKLPGYRQGSDDERVVGSFWWPHDHEPTVRELLAIYLGDDLRAALAAEPPAG